MIYFLLALQLSCLLAVIRNNEIFSYRAELLEALFDSKDWATYLVIWMRVRPHRMMLYFWRHPSSFYPKELNDLLEKNDD